MGNNRGTGTGKHTLKNRLAAGITTLCNKCGRKLTMENIRQYQEHYAQICRACHNQQSNKYKAEQRIEDSKYRVNNTKQFFFRSCLNCDASFNTSNRFLRLCETCRSQSLSRDIEMHRLHL